MTTKTTKPMASKQRTAFITARKGVCYLTIKIRKRNFDVKRIRNYTLDAPRINVICGGDTRMSHSTGRKSPGDWLRSGRHAVATAPGGGSFGHGGPPPACPRRLLRRL